MSLNSRTFFAARGSTHTSARAVAATLMQPAGSCAGAAAILRLLRSTGVAVDAVSLGEIERALRAGYVPGTAAHEIVFTADIIDEATLARVLELRIPVNCGSPDMVSRPIVVPRMPESAHFTR